MRRIENHTEGLTVVQAKKTKPDKHTVYGNAVSRWHEKYENNPEIGKDELIKILYLEVKSVAIEKREKRKHLTLEEAEGQFQFLCAVIDLLSVLTPIEFMRLFPAEKTYNGKKYGCKDYFSTMEAMKSYPPEEPIGSDKIQDFMWSYMNDDIADLEVEQMMAMSNIRRLQGQKGLAEEFFDSQGVQGYTFFEEDGVARNHATGEWVKMEKPKKRVPKQFKVIK